MVQHKMMKKIYINIVLLRRPFYFLSILSLFQTLWTLISVLAMEIKPHRDHARESKQETLRGEWKLLISLGPSCQW